MKYLSVCSGIEAATVAWHHLGWQPIAFSEIEPFPSAVLAHHYPNVPNLGDMTKFEEWNLEAIDLLVGGTPCQSFSVAGLRKGLADPRGNLMLTFLAIAQRQRPRWIVWENVPGVLSSNGGRDFGTFLQALGELGYGWAYRVLDAQWFGVAQRRRRVFVVGYLGDWRRAAAVLFESESVRRDTPPSREKGQGTAAYVEGGVELCGPLNARDYKDPGTDGMNRNSAKMVPVSATFCARRNGFDLEVETPVIAPTLQANDGAKWGSNQWVDEGKAIVQPVVFDWQSGGDARGLDSKETAMLQRNQVPAVAQPTYGIPGNWIGRQPENGGNAVEPMHDVSPCLTKTDRHGVATMQVRRLTPVECERLQGFPDGYTNIPWRKKPDAPDGPRYKALGNSMAVPVMRWLGERINKADNDPLA
jgi:DNA (cytosine-5)-methyltransferase 1